MAEKNSTGYTVFNPEKSTRMQQISALGDQVAKRYLTKGTISGDDWWKKMNAIAQEKNADGRYMFPRCKSLIPFGSWNVITSAIINTLEQRIPEGYQIDAKKLVIDLETLMQENPSEFDDAVLGINDFIRDISKAMTSVVLKAIQSYEKNHSVII